MILKQLPLSRIVIVRFPWSGMRGSTLIVLYGLSDFEWNFLLTKQNNSKRNADALDLALDGKKNLTTTNVIHNSTMIH